MRTWQCERHDKITYHVSHPRKLGGGTITRLARNKWHAESHDTGETATCPTLTKAFWWTIEQANAADKADTLEGSDVTDEKITEDERTFGRNRWVYCSQHLRPHVTGWCTVSVRDKVLLDATERDAAYAEARGKSMKILGESI